MAPSEATDPPAPAMRDDGLPLVAPDVVEETEPEEIDDPVPTRGYQMLPVVGLGGSAGSVSALREFFENAPTPSGLAYVVVLHLSPDHDSSMPGLLQRYTAMPVRSAADGDLLAADTVYVIPPGMQLTAFDGSLRLAPLEPAKGKRVAVDLFFRSLADTHGPHATAVVLSGADGDGTIGLRRVKERGGLTIAQDPDEADHRSMPGSAIATGMVDWVLSAKAMPARIVAYHERAARLELPAEEGPQPATPVARSSDEREAQLHEVLSLLHARTGRDFSYYKRATIVRRISRRMQVSGTETLGDYLAFLRTNPGEAGALLHDLLISVTNFFRDREAFQQLEARIPELFRDKRAGDVVRVWCAACASGEEPYSMAMLLLEHASTLEAPPTLQVFGCDLDDEAIQVARAGLYPASIVADVSEQRLQRFFVKEPGGYRVRRELREMVLFTEHDLLKDAPFSRMDLVSCRNLLIYLNRDAQARALELFHFALKPGGLLFLGSSESIGDSSAAFSTVDKKHRIYAQRPSRRIGLPMALGAGITPIDRLLRQHERLKQFVPPALPGRAFVTGPMLQLPAEAAPEPAMRASELHFRLLGQFGPPSLVVDSRHDIVHLSENAKDFLQLPEGEPTKNFLRLVHPTLRLDLRGALRDAAQSGAPVHVPGRPVSLAGGTRDVAVRVSPAGDLAAGCFLVLFEAHPMEERPGTPVAFTGGTVEPSRVVEELERELTGAHADLRSTIEQYEASGEDLKASNEELQAMNEELRSASEELETGREELQSVNEELTTVNAEFKDRVDELGRANSDLHNLMRATQFPTVFLGRELQVMRYTPSAAPLFNLIPSDIGRPITHLNHRLAYPELASDVAQVLGTLVPVERELRDDGRWYLARILPYRTIDDHIAGAVLTFVDISDRRRAEQVVQASEERQKFLLRLSDLVRSLEDPIEIQGAAMRMLGDHLHAARAHYFFVDPGARDGPSHVVEAEYRRAPDLPTLVGRHPVSAYGDALLDDVEHGRIVQVDDVSALQGLSPEALERFRSADIAAFVHVPLMHGEKFRSGIAVLDAAPRSWTTADIGLIEEVAARTWFAIGRARAEEALRDSEERYRTLFDSIDEAFCVFELVYDAHGHAVDWIYRQANPAFTAQTGYADPVGKRLSDFQPTLARSWFEQFETVARTGAPVRFVQRDETRDRWYDVYAMRVGESGSERVSLLFNDVSQQKREEHRRDFLLKLADALRAVAEPAGIQAKAMRVLGEHLGVTRAQYYEAGPGDGILTAAGGYASGVEPVAGRVVLEDFGAFVGEALAAGRTIAVADVGTDPRVDEAALPSYQALAVRAYLALSLVKGERLVAVLALHQSTPRTWTAEEIELAEETGQRTWAAMERAQAEVAMRASEEKYRTLFESMDEAYCIVQMIHDEAGTAVDIRFLQVNPAFAVNSGLADAAGRTLRELAPTIEQKWFDSLDRVARSGDPSRIVEDSAALGRVLSLYAFRIGEPGECKVAAVFSDITERTSAEGRLRESEERLRLAVEASDLGTWEWHLPSNEVFWNDRHFRLFGTAPHPNPIDAVEFFRHVHPDDRARIETELRDSISRRGPFDTEFRAVLDDGATRWMSGYGRVVEESADGEPLKMSGVMLDITLRKQMEEAWNESESRLGAVANIVPDLLWSSAPDGHTHWYNERWMAYTGQTPAQAHGWGWLDAIHPDDRPRSALRYRQAIERSESLEQEHRIRNREGEYRWHLARAEPMRDAEGRVVRMFGAATDIHDLRTAAEALRASEEQTRAIADRLPGGAVFVVDPDLRYVLAGGEALQATRTKPDTFIGRSVHDVLEPEVAAQHVAHYRQALAGEPFTTEHVSDGRHYLTRGGPLRDAQGRVTAALAVSYDITDRKAAEDAVRRSEERLRTLADAVPQIIWTNDGDGTANYFNQRWYEYSGLSFEQSFGLGWEVIVHPDDAAASKRNWHRVLAEGEVFECEYRLRDAQGRYRWFIGRNVPMLDADGGVTSWFGTATDVDDLKNAEAAAKTSEEQFRRAIEEAPIPVIMQAEDGQVLQISKRWTALTGYTREDIPTFDEWLARAYGTGADSLRAHIRSLFEGTATQLETQFHVTTRSGDRRRWAFTASLPGQLRDGRRFVVAMALDITERTLAEEALAESQERLRLILENAREYAILSLDLDLNITSWNAGAQTITGYHPDEAIGLRSHVIFTEEQREAGIPEQEARQALAEDRAADERWHLRRDGSRFWASGVMTVMHDAVGKAIGFVKIFSDQTAALLAKEALEQQRQQLMTSLQDTERARAEAERATQAKDHFLAVLSHELRTPLTPVLMASQILSRNKSLPPTVLHALAIIERNVRLETDLVDDLLDITRISSGKVELDLQPLHLHDAIAAAVEVSAPDIDAKRQQFVVELGADDDLVSGDGKRLQQTLWNLLKNASKFTPPEGRVNLRTRNAGGHIVVEVADTGMGFAPEAAERIFDAFEQASRAITRQYGGLGLGLAISKASIEAHGGTIDAASDGVGRGATFTIELPLIEAA